MVDWLHEQKMITCERQADLANAFDRCPLHPQPSPCAQIASRRSRMRPVGKRDAFSVLA